jgi:CBS domain-containing protein
MLLKDIMSKKVESVRLKEPLARARMRMKERGIHHLVVVNRGKTVGVISAADLETRLAEGVARVEDAMAGHARVANPGMTVAQAARMMRGCSQGALPVMSGPRLVGIVTISDLLDVLGGRSAHARPAAAPTRS